MGSFILCNEKKAVQPYFLEDIHLNIFTIEELCFYLCNNLYLLNHSIMNKDLCEWIDTELNMTKLSEDLARSVTTQALSRFVITILEAVGFCSDEELEDIQHTLMSLKDQTEEEQRKKRADNLLKNGKFEHAFREYEKILKTQNESKLRPEFFGKIHHNMGTALAKQFLFKEASEEYLKAYKITQLQESLKEFLCACYLYFPKEEFDAFIDDNESFRTQADKMRNEYVEQERQYRFFQEQKSYVHTGTQKRIDEIKEEYRKSLL